MDVELKKISTESRNPNTINIDKVSTTSILTLINNEDQSVALAVKEAIPQIAKVVDLVYESFLKGGRLIYMGAGTSGRIGILDAVECPPTYGVSYEMVQCLMAGGSSAFVKAKEGAEDSKIDAKDDLISININSNDFVIGIAASGRTPYVLGGIEYAKSLGVKCGCITTSKDSILEKLVDYPIVAYTGPEVITGSTRMKSGTAQKLICNMISTASMIKMGKVYENYMIDVKATNDKLVARSISIICDIIDCDSATAKSLLEKYGSIKKVIFNHFTKVSDPALIDKFLDDASGNIRIALDKYLEDGNEN